LVFVVMFILSSCTGQEEVRSATKLISGPRLEETDKYVGTIRAEKAPRDPYGETYFDPLYHWTSFEVNINPDRDCVTFGGGTVSAEFRVKRGYMWIEGPLNTFCLEKVE